MTDRYGRDIYEGLWQKQSLLFLFFWPKNLSVAILFLGFREKTCEKVAIWPKKVAICPLLKIKVASKNYEIS